MPSEMFLTAALALTSNLWLDQPVRSSIGLLMILAGLPCYRGWRGRNQRLAQAPVM